MLATPCIEGMERAFCSLVEKERKAVLLSMAMASPPLVSMSDDT